MRVGLANVVHAKIPSDRHVVKTSSILSVGGSTFSCREFLSTKWPINDIVHRGIDTIYMHVPQSANAISPLARAAICSSPPTKNPPVARAKRVSTRQIAFPRIALLPKVMPEVFHR